MSVTATLLQIDLQNLFFEARNRDRKIDLEKVLQHFKAREAEFLTDALIYMIRGENFDSSKFEAKLKDIGYTIRIKNSYKMIRDNRVFYRQTNHDVNITIDCLDKLDTYDKWILMSGDGDFIELCKYLRKKGKQVEIWSFKECLNKDIDRYADKINYIDKKFFLKIPKISVFGFNWDWGPQ